MSVNPKTVSLHDTSISNSVQLPCRTSAHVKNGFLRKRLERIECLQAFLLRTRSELWLARSHSIPDMAQLATGIRGCVLLCRVNGMQSGGYDGHGRDMSLEEVESMLIR